MTAYVDCKECGDPVPWYYAWLYGPVAQHPGCAKRRIDDEGCGAAWLLVSRIGDEVAASAKGGAE